MSFGYVELELHGSCWVEKFKRQSQTHVWRSRGRLELEMVGDVIQRC